MAPAAPAGRRGAMPPSPPSRRRSAVAGCRWNCVASAVMGRPGATIPPRRGSAITPRSTIIASRSATIASRSAAVSPGTIVAAAAIHSPPRVRLPIPPVSVPAGLIHVAIADLVARGRPAACDVDVASAHADVATVEPDHAGARCTKIAPANPHVAVAAPVPVAIDPDRAGEGFGGHLLRQRLGRRLLHHHPVRRRPVLVILVIHVVRIASPEQGDHGSNADVLHGSTPVAASPTQVYRGSGHAA